MSETICKPRISVIIPYKDRHDHLLRCLLSIENQLVKPSEVILVNDGGAPVVLDREYSFDVAMLCNETNYGAAYSRNKGAKKARGDFLFFLDSDDEWAQDHIQNVILKLEDYPEVGFFVSGYGKKFDRSKVSKNKIIDDVVLICNPSEFQFITNGSFRTSAFAIERSEFFSVDGFDEKQKKHQDWDFAFRYCEITGKNIVAILNKTVLIDSFAPGRMSYSSNLKASIYFYKKHRDSMCFKSKYLFIKGVFLGVVKSVI